MDDILSDKFAQETLGFDEAVQIDKENMICGGHSFGGMTGIGVAHEDDRVKAVFAFDPWLWCEIEGISSNEYFLKQPQIYITTENFSPIVNEFFKYDTIKSLDLMIENSPSKD